MFKYFSKLQGWNRTTSRTLIRQPSSLNLFKLIKCTTDAGTFQSFELIVATYMLIYNNPSLLYAYSCRQTWKWTLQDSNLRPNGYEPFALTN